MILLNGNCVSKSMFPDGTMKMNVHLDGCEERVDSNEMIYVDWLYENDSEQIILYNLVKHIRSAIRDAPIDLFLPYVPNARMDRVKSRDEVFTLKYFCDFINGLCFNRVFVRDTHSSVSLALLNNVFAQPVKDTIEDIISDVCPDILFYPDEGSCKRYSGMLTHPCAFGIKVREWETGQITGLDVVGEIPQQPFSTMIVDDISSYGGTFYHSAKKLKELGAKKIYLYITHCENSILEGELIKSGLVDRIFTTRSIFTSEHPLITIV